MTHKDDIEMALSLSELELPKKPRIVNINWDIYEDSSGDEGLENYVVLDDKTSDREIERAPIHEIKKKIIDSLARRKVKLFPYFHFERESEHVPPIRED